MKLSIAILILVFTISITSCKKIIISKDLKKTKWVENGGTGTIEFTKKQLIVNGVELRESGEKIYVENGQIWKDNKGDLTYLYDYKLSGNNLFVSIELTANFFDPSSPSSLGIKYNPE